MGMTTNEAAYWVAKLDMGPHPEGGYYKEVYRSLEEVIPANAHVKKCAITSIYYLLEKDDFSAFHRITSDEIWYFHKGSPLIIHAFDQHRQLESLELSDRDSGVLSHVVKKGKWFASELKEQEGFVLVSCAVAPGFDFADFELATRENLNREFPEQKELINRLCRS